MLRKNTAGQFVYFALASAVTGAPLTGATVTGRRIIDGTAAALGATITEPNADGFYQAALTQADTNGNDIGYFFTATNAVPVGMTAITTACDPTSAAFGLSLAKTTNITGFNDIAASSIVSSGAITTSGGAVSTVSAVTGLTASNLDATISSRMATYTQPTGFLAATFPTGTVANTTNITAGIITTTTNLTNNNDKTGYSLTQTFPANFDTLIIAATGEASADIKKVNATTVTGAGTPASPWGP